MNRLKAAHTLILCSLLAKPTTTIPLSAKDLEMAAPIPTLLPVTTATFPIHLSIVAVYFSEI